MIGKKQIIAFNPVSLPGERTCYCTKYAKSGTEGMIFLSRLPHAITTQNNAIEVALYRIRKAFLICPGKILFPVSEPASIFDTPVHQPGRLKFYATAASIGLAVFLVLAVFQPFGTYVFEHRFKILILAGYGLLIPLAAAAVREVLVWLFPRFWARGAWTLRREFTVYLLLTLTSIIASYFYHHLVIGSRLSVTGFFGFLMYAAMTAAFPLALLFIFRYFETKQMSPAQQSPSGLATITLRGENKRDILTVFKNDLLYLRGADNYVELFLWKNDRTERLLLRGSLAAMLAQLEHDPDFLQVHRSYIVNFSQPVRLEGKSPAYMLLFDHATVEPAPVSRANVAPVREILARKPR